MMKAAKMIQVRNVSPRLHRELTRRARSRGETLTQYVQTILEREIARPSAEEVFDRISLRRPTDLDGSAANLIRAARNER